MHRLPVLKSDFRKLWAAQAISQTGSWLGALGLLAIFQLDATPAQMGYLETARALPVLLIGLFAGVWADRFQRRPILIGADGGRFVLLGGVVLLAWLGWLRMEILYVAGFLVGCLTIFFDIAVRSYLPTVVPRRDLVRANSHLSSSEIVAEIGSPGLGGLLYQLIGGPLTLLVDAFSFLGSALLLGTIRTPEKAAGNWPMSDSVSDLVPESAPESVRQEIGAGVRAIWQNPILSALLVPLATRSFFGNFFAPLYALFVIQDVGLSAALMGLTVGAGGLGALPATFITERISARLGIGRTMVAGRIMAALLGILVPLAAGWDAAWMGLFLLIIAQFAGDFFSTIHDILAMSIRQSAAPEAMLGRVNAGFEVVIGGCGMVGILVGGLLGSALGMRTTLFIAVAGILGSAILLALSPIAQMHEMGGQESSK